MTVPESGVASLAEGRETHAKHPGKESLAGPDCGQRSRLGRHCCPSESRLRIELLGLQGRRRTVATGFWRHPGRVGHPPPAPRRYAYCFEAVVLEEVGWRCGVLRLQALVNKRSEGSSHRSTQAGMRKRLMTQCVTVSSFGFITLGVAGDRLAASARIARLCMGPSAACISHPGSSLISDSRCNCWRWSGLRFASQRTTAALFRRPVPMWVLMISS